jgi:hypothetical protein
MKRIIPCTVALFLAVNSVVLARCFMDTYAECPTEINQGGGSDSSVDDWGPGKCELQYSLNGSGTYPWIVTTSAGLLSYTTVDPAQCKYACGDGTTQWRWTGARATGGACP